MTSSVFSVTGMTCQHCVASVTTEVSAVDGVDSVNVNLDEGRVTVSGHGVDPQQVVVAIAEAGYEAHPA